MTDQIKSSDPDFAQPLPEEQRDKDSFRLTLVRPARVFYDLPPDQAEYLDGPEPQYQEPSKEAPA